MALRIEIANYHSLLRLLLRWPRVPPGAAVHRPSSGVLVHAPALQPVRVEAQRVVGNLAAAYLADPRLLPDAWHRGDDADAVTVARNVGDYLAGMTDPFAISRHEALIGPVELPEKF